MNQAQYWDRIAAHYDLKYYHSDNKAVRNAVLLVSASHMAIFDYVLELGCGTGKITAELGKCEGLKIDALDISPEMICEAMKRRTSNHYLWGVNFQVGDAEHLVGQNAYDVVLGNYILMYTDLFMSLTNVYKVLKPKGRFAFIELNAFNPLGFTLTRTPIKYLFHKSKEANSLFPHTVNKVCKEIGFSKYSVEWIGGSLLISGVK